MSLITETALSSKKPISARLKEMGGLIGKLTVREMRDLVEIIGGNDAEEELLDMLLRTSDEIAARPCAQRDTKEVRSA